jgi:hypothetical protein
MTKLNPSFIRLKNMSGSSLNKINPYFACIIDTKLNYIIDKWIENEIVDKSIRLYRYSTGGFNDFIKDKYNKGARVFFTTTNSQLSEEIFPFLESHKDVLFFSCTSTVNFEEKPDNFLRTSTLDITSLKYILEEILPKMDNLNSLIENTIIEDLVPNDLGLVIDDIILIYGDDTYGNGIKNDIEILKENFDGMYSFKYYKIQENIQEDLIEELTDNNKRKIFIVATLQPDVFMNIYDKEEYFQKIFIFSDTFTYNDKNINLNFPINNSYIMINTESRYGYIISKSIYSEMNIEQTDPQIDMLLETINTLFSIIEKYFGKNLNELIDKLIHLRLFKNGQLFNKFLNLYLIYINDKILTYNKKISFFSYNGNGNTVNSGDGDEFNLYKRQNINI